MAALRSVFARGNKPCTVVAPAHSERSIGRPSLGICALSAACAREHCCRLLGKPRTAAQGPSLELLRYERQDATAAWLAIERLLHSAHYKHWVLAVLRPAGRTPCCAAGCSVKLVPGLGAKFVWEHVLSKCLLLQCWVFRPVNPIRVVYERLQCCHMPRSCAWTERPLPLLLVASNSNTSRKCALMPTASALLTRGRCY